MVYNIHECNIIKCIIYVHLLLKLKPLLAAVYRSVSRDSMKDGRHNTETRSRKSSSSSMGGKQEVKSPSGILNLKTLKLVQVFFHTIARHCNTVPLLLQILLMKLAENTRDRWINLTSKNLQKIVVSYYFLLR